jgi:hypothetical protein
MGGAKVQNSLEGCKRENHRDTKLRFLTHSIVKGRPAMQNISSPPSLSASVSVGAMMQPVSAEERAYQAMTVAAILLVLGSLWLF